MGSTVHGTALEGTDDRDEMAILLESPKIGLTLGNPFESVFLRTQPEGVRSGPDDLDLQVHSLRKFLRLALKGNPSILLMFFLPEYLVKTKVGEELIELAPSFHSQHAANAFLGYMKQQMERMTGQRGQKNVNRPELVERYGYDTKYAGHIIRLGYQGVEYIETGALTLPMKKEEAQTVLAVREGKYLMEDVLNEGRVMMEKMERLKEECPPEPKTDLISSWMRAAYLDDWAGTKF